MFPISQNQCFPFLRGLREQATGEGREPKHLAYAKPQDDLAKVAANLSTHKCSMSPVLSCDPSGREVWIGGGCGLKCGRKYGGLEAQEVDLTLLSLLIA